MRFPVASFFAVALTASAQASCVLSPEKVVHVWIENVSKPVYDARGNQLRGCLLHAEGKVIGYSNQEGLCSSKLGVTRRVRLS